MSGSFDIGSLVERGGVFSNVPGSSAEEIYSNLFSMVTLPDYCKRINLVDELIIREKVLSTAVGNGVAIPHPRRPIMRSERDERIIVCYPQHPINMKAPDRKSVNAMFFILAHSSTLHLEALSALAKALKTPLFREVLESKPCQSDLIEALKKYSV